MIAKIRKAIAAAVGAGYGAYLTAITDNHVTTEEWIYVASAAIATGIVTWFIPNRRQDPPQ